jgi:Sec-independent protein translocase protein TatA
MGGVSWGSLIVIVALIYLLLGKNEVSNLGLNLDKIIKNFKKGLSDKE